MQDDFESVYLDLQRECLIEGTRIVSMGAWIYDLDRDQVYWSEGVYDVHGVSDADGPLSLEDSLAFYVEADRVRVREALARIQREGGSYDFECELTTAQGVHKFVRVIGKSGGHLADCKNCLFGVVQDVSDTRRIRDALIEARDQANAANQVKSNFLATVSHELRTPLNPIMGFSNILLEEVEDEEQLEMLRLINEAGQHLHDTINRILEFAEFDPEKKKLSKDRFVLSDLIAEVVYETNRSLPELSVEVESEREAEVPADLMLVGDFNKVKCVLSNLLGNAAKFSGVQSVKVRSVLKSLDAAHVLWHVDVQDEGVGIDPKLLDHVFDPFLLGDSTCTRAQGGSGMGLAVCRSYVELMDGRISVQSKPGEGATFSFYICLSIAANLEDDDAQKVFESDVSDAAAAEAVVAVAPEEPEEVEEPEEAPVSVLMVEDNATNVYYQSRILEKMGCQVTTALDGRQALDIYQPGKFDLVLLDLHMPGIDGIEVLKSLRVEEAVSGAERVPVIVLTADLLTSTQAVCRECGADEFVSKPVKYNDLRRKIIDVLSDCSSEIEL
jgi:signal transduction histidine kinase/ActR/RegA family two-component response regulator